MAHGGLAFDRDGNLWTGTGGASVSRIPAVRLAQGGHPAADVEVRIEGRWCGGAARPSLAFDRRGGLWLSDGCTDGIVRFDATQLAAPDADVRPSVTIHGMLAVRARALVFDGSGNLWIANASADRIARYDAARLTASTSAPPDRVLRVQRITAGTGVIPSDTAVTLEQPTGMAIDSAGNLWVAYFRQRVIARLTPENLAGTGEATVPASVFIEIANAAFDDLAFDEGGGLWTTIEPGVLGRLSPMQLQSSGVKTPETRVEFPGFGSRNADYGWRWRGFAFCPGASTTPLAPQP